MADAQILRAARGRIADPIHWTNGTMARDEVGGAVQPMDRRAVCWCALGALRAEKPNYSIFSPETNALRNVALRRHGLSVAGVNDVLGHEAVLALYDAAIATAEAGA